jgi:transcriptional regulator with XRE-family HTH domain
MTKIKKIGYDFLKELRENKTPPPNNLTVGMGVLIRKARESKGWSQKELAKQISSRQSTISDIEQGKNEIGILTLSIISFVLDKPISYFFPEGILKSHIADVNSADQQKLLEMFKELEDNYGSVFALKLMELYYNHYMEQVEAAEHGYDEIPPEPTDEEIAAANSDEYEV